MAGFIDYVETCCPHKRIRFDVWDVNKTLRPSHVLCNILGYCWPIVPLKSVRHSLLSKVKEYKELWFFLRILKLVKKHFEAGDIPSRMYDDITSVSRYLNFCESLQDLLYEEVKHYPSPKGAVKQLDLYTHWYDYTELGDVLRKNGIVKNDVLEAYDLYRKLPKGYGVHAFVASVGEMFMQKKFSPDWYRLKRRHGAIMKRVDEIRAENGSVPIWYDEKCR